MGRLKITRRDYRRGTKTGVPGKDTKAGKAREAKRTKDASEVNVVKRAKQIRARRDKMRKSLDDAGDYSKSAVNDLDQVNREMEHANDSDDIRRIFEK